VTRAIFYDGVTANRHDVAVSLGSENSLMLSGEGIAAVSVPFAELAVVDEDARLLMLSRASYPGWRLLFDQPVDPALRALLPRPARYGSWIDRIGLAKASAILAGIAAVVLFVGYSAPAWLAPFVPESWERNVGTAIVGDFGDNACRDPAATRALATMTGRIDPAGSGHPPITMTLIDVGIFNAAALPGQQIVIFDGALREAKDPNAMAGILAHEISHVRRRHVTQALIRELGIGALIRLFAGDIGANAQQLVSLSYTRANEYQADGDAIAALQRARIDPRPTGALFAKLSKGEDAGGLGAVEFLNSHPATGDRAKRFAAAFRKGTAYTPALSAAEYKAMRTACPAKRDAERDREEEAAKKD
jgi:Zn-dependent protease with chaperone function